MKSPPHLGGFIRREIIEPLGLSVTDAASALGVTRQALSNLLNARTSLSADMALRIEKAFGPKMDFDADAARLRPRRGAPPRKRDQGQAFQQALGCSLSVNQSQRGTRAWYLR